MSSRREFLTSATHVCFPAALNPGVESSAMGQSHPDKQRYLLIGLCGSENPTRANFPFVWATALHDAGHEVRIELAGDATVLMRSPVSDNVTPVGWPPLRGALAKVIEYKIPIFV